MNMVMAEQNVSESQMLTEICAQIEDVVEIASGFTGNFQFFENDMLAGIYVACCVSHSPFILSGSVFCMST